LEKKKNKKKINLFLLKDTAFTIWPVTLWAALRCLISASCWKHW